MPCNPCCCDSDDFTLNDTRPKNLWVDILISCALCPLVAYTYIESEIEKRRSGTSPLPPVTTPPKSPAPPIAVLEETEERDSEIARDAPTIIPSPEPAATNSTAKN